MNSKQSFFQDRLKKIKEIEVMLNKRKRVRFSPFIALLCCSLDLQAEQLPNFPELMHNEYISSIHPRKERGKAAKPILDYYFKS